MAVKIEFSSLIVSAATLKSTMVSMFDGPSVARNTKLSAPALPVSVSEPPPPLSMLAPELPVITLARRIARAADVGGARQRQVLDILTAEAEAHRTLHRVSALAALLDDDVIGIVDPVAVVARTADHSVGIGAAIEDIVARIAGEHVGQGVARGVDVAVAGQRQVLDVGR